MSEKSSDLLLVDDSPMDMELTVHALEHLHLTGDIHVAEDGKEALDYVFCRGKYEGRELTDRPCVILLDLKLPKVDGLQVLEAIRADGRTRSIPVVILTSSKEHRDVIEAYRLGASAFVQKPVDFDQFQKTIGEIGAFWINANEPPPPEAFQREDRGLAGAD